MRFQRLGVIAGLAAAAVALSACGSDNTSSSSGGSSAAGGDRDCFSGTLNGAGSSAQNPAVNAWVQAYQAKCSGAAINYTAQGSGNGRTQFIQRQVTWAGSDSAPKEQQKADADARCAGGKAIDLPMVITPVAVVYNLSGGEKLAQNQLKTVAIDTGSGPVPISEASVDKAISAAKVATMVATSR